MSPASAASAVGPASPAGPASPVGPASGSERPRRRTAWTVAAVLSALLIVAPGAWWAWSHHGAPVSGTLSGGSADRAVTALEIDAGEAAVTVTPRADQRVEYRAVVRWSLRRPEIEESRLGDTLRLTPRCPGTGGALGAGLGCTVDLAVSVPAGIPVKVTGTSGKIEISGLGGAVDVATDSGRLRLTALRGPLRAEVASGSLEATALTSPSADLRAESGSAVAAFLTPPDRITARSASGKVAVTVPVATRLRVDRRAGSGSLEVARGLADPAAPGHLDIATGSGRATAGFP
ncbi:hypothetical protein ABT084_24465 [Streptomyces sp. NPDC002138]|uniref:hypothetical protein n=1 Tax=Streptomyces sp. NPDC002138 TaxID=3154410 RepID=UPI0033252532